MVQEYQHDVEKLMNSNRIKYESELFTNSYVSIMT